MGIFDKFKKKKLKKEKLVSPVAEKKKIEKIEKLTAGKKKIQVSPEKKEEKIIERKKEIKGKTPQAPQILIKPVVTEKATQLGAFNQYVFQVTPGANKIEVKKAIRTIYGVDPINVNIIKIKGKEVRYGRTGGRRKDWKKAIVTLKKEDKIEIYEGV